MTVMRTIWRNMNKEQIYDETNRKNALYPGSRVYTGHCTGDIARKSLLEAGSDVQIFHTGSVIEL